MIMKVQRYDYAFIGHHIKQARKAKKYTQEVLSEKVGVGVKHISDMECGYAGLSVDVLIKLCEVLEVDADYILFGKITVDRNNPLNKLMENLTPQQSLQAQKLLDAYIKSLD